MRAEIQKILLALGLGKVGVEVQYAPEHDFFVWTAESSMGQFKGSLQIEEEFKIHELCRMAKIQACLGVAMHTVPEGPTLVQGMRLANAFPGLPLPVAGVCSMAMGALGPHMAKLVDENDPKGSIKRIQGRRVPSTSKLIKEIVQEFEGAVEAVRSRAINDVTRQLEERAKEIT